MARQSDMNVSQACRDTPWLHGFTICPPDAGLVYGFTMQATLVCVVIRLINLTQSATFSDSNWSRGVFKPFLHKHKSPMYLLHFGFVDYKMNQI